MKAYLLEALQKLTVDYSPQVLYLCVLCTIFENYLKELDLENFENQNRNLKETVIWRKLYDFQKDAVSSIIDKLNRFNGCILADSVGLGKTFTALAIIKYYQMRGKNIMVLCPKKLSNYWTTFNSNVSNNPLIKDKLRYDVFYHTDLSRIHSTVAKRGDVYLKDVRWGEYDLVVIDESHNFRNGSNGNSEDTALNRYDVLKKEIISNGCETKLLMLSATPVNNRFKDLKNQIELSYIDGKSTSLEESMNMNKTINSIFDQAERAYKQWGDFEPKYRTTKELIKMINFDFFEFLDNVTIARSRKHIREYYDDKRIGVFPERLKPISLSPCISNIGDVDYEYFFNKLLELYLCVYTPSKYIKKECRDKYADVFKDKSFNKAFSQENREYGLSKLMTINLMKRMESSINSFKLTINNIINHINSIIKKIDICDVGNFKYIDTFEEDFEESADTDDEYSFLNVGKKIKISFNDIEKELWKDDLTHDLNILNELYKKASDITPDIDAKLGMLKTQIINKLNNPINESNRKILIFTAFADTANYLYQNLKEWCLNRGLNIGVVTGSKILESTIHECKNEFNNILTYFSPISKERAISENQNDELDILIGTDCISEGQNLQDCDTCVNYDIHWNPVRIIQRYGRIDRLGSKNKYIRLINFWPNISLDSYINLKQRVESRMKIVRLTGGGSEGQEIDEEENIELEYRKNQLEKLKNESVDLEDISNNISISDLGLNEFRLDLLSIQRENKIDDIFFNGIYSVASATEKYPAGVIFLFKKISKIKIVNQNRIDPYYLCYVDDTGNVIYSYSMPKEILQALKTLCLREDDIQKRALNKFMRETEQGKNMTKYRRLLGLAVESFSKEKLNQDIEGLFNRGGVNINNNFSGLKDFELISYLVIK